MTSNVRMRGVGIKRPAQFAIHTFVRFDYSVWSRIVHIYKNLPFLLAQVRVHVGDRLRLKLQRDVIRKKIVTRDDSTAKRDQHPDSAMMILSHRTIADRVQSLHPS
jgi:hypothetical protein